MGILTTPGQASRELPGATGERGRQQQRSLANHETERQLDLSGNWIRKRFNQLAHRQSGQYFDPAILRYCFFAVEGNMTRDQKTVVAGAVTGIFSMLEG